MMQNKNLVNLDDESIVNEYVVPIIDLMLERRRSLKISQQQLSDNSGVPRLTIHRIENLECIPKISTLCKILYALNLDINCIEREN